MLIENTQKEKDKSKDKDLLPKHDKDRSKKFDTPTAFPGTGDRGFRIWRYATNPTTGALAPKSGIIAYHDIETGFTIPRVNVTIYAPTHQPVAKACIETVTVHWTSTSFSGTRHAHGFWDHCGAKSWTVFEEMTNEWRAKYARNSWYNRYQLYTQVYSPSDRCWVGLLYNYAQGAWETKTPTICGTASHNMTEGWSMWESYGLMDDPGNTICPNIPGIGIRGGFIYNPGSDAWGSVGASNVTPIQTGQCWQNGSYKWLETVASGGSLFYWDAGTPNYHP